MNEHIEEGKSTRTSNIEESEYSAFMSDNLFMPNRIFGFKAFIDTVSKATNKNPYNCIFFLIS